MNMSNQGEKLLIPQDFMQDIPEAFANNVFVTDTKFEKTQADNDKLIVKINQDLNINYSNIMMAQEAKETNNSILNCLNPKNYLPNYCLKNINSHTTIEEPSFRATKSYSAPVLKFATVNSGNCLRNDTFKAHYSLTENVKINNLNQPQSSHNEYEFKLRKLLTPNTFNVGLSFQLEKDENFDGVSFVPEVSKEAPPPFKVINSSTNDVQISYVPVNESLPLSSTEESEKKSLETGSINIEEKYLKKNQSSLLMPENFSSGPSVRRKLNFETPQYNNATKNESEISTNSSKEKNKPKFYCALKIPENIYESLSLETKENALSNFSFQKNPFPPIGVFWDIENCRVSNQNCICLQHF